MYGEPSYGRQRSKKFLVQIKQAGMNEESM